MNSPSRERRKEERIIGKYFSDAVDQAVADVYYCYDSEKAEAGCLFCQYMIGNIYYFLDVIEIGDRSEQEFGSREVWDN